MSSGSAWPTNDGPNAPLLTGVSDRSAGIGFFFPRLDHVTRNAAYLGEARRAAHYIASTQHPSDAASELVQSPGLPVSVAAQQTTGNVAAGLIAYTWREKKPSPNI